MTPTELILKPGETIALTGSRVRRQRRRRCATRAGDVDAREPEGHGRRREVHGGQAPRRRRPAWSRRRVGTQVGAARIRVIPDLPWSFDFEDGRETPPPQWANATNKFAVRDLDGSKVLVKLAENDFAFAKRCRPFFGSPDASNYTIEADVRALERRRQMGDIGVVAQRYELVLFGNHQRLDLQPWQPETARTVKRAAQVGKGHLVHDQARGAVARRRQGPRAREGLAEGSARAGAWTIERVDPIGNHKGAPGIYADAPSRVGGGSELYYDNIKVYKNK